MFFKGFEKTSGIKDVAKALGRALGRGRGQLLGTIEKGHKGLKETGKGFKEEFSQAAQTKRKEILGKKDVSTELAAKRTARGKSTTPEKVRKEMGKRVKSIRGIRESKKPTFIEKHPYVSAASGLLAGKMLFGEKSQSSQAQVIPPNY
jgi:hypothetical protein